MGTMLRTIFHTLKVFCLFVCFTILFYIGMVWLNQEYQDYNRYDEPQGSSLKVSATEHANEHTDWFERLKLFYLNGE
ncbi:YqzK family protein [Bacillus sp. 1P06AnD]|uniref:YqzK family protein n=1 Tax=Bacillus sp. 1P06AnD TaxID=3132208 RepID=UPI0039A0A481